MQGEKQNGLVEGSASTNPARLRVVVADDSRVIQAQLTYVLRGLGHEVTTVDTGLAAVKITGEREFDLVFMDLEMPVMGGVEATVAIRKRDLGIRKLTIIAMTAHAKGDWEQHCREIGMDGCLTKPVGAPEVYALLSPLADSAHPTL